MLNGTKVDLLAAACHSVGDEKTVCGNGNDWRFDPLHSANGFHLDNHNAHTQPDGSYHYHGNPKALFSDSAIESPLIGFAADGFPIFGTWFNDGSTIKKAVSCFRVKSRARPADNGAPGGNYYVTEAFPYMMGCFKGTMDASF